MHVPVVLTSAQVAARFGVTVHTVRRWVKEGRLTVAFRTPGGLYRFYEEDLPEHGQ
jgi:excisionase family DNA binding protein